MDNLEVSEKVEVSENAEVSEKEIALRNIAINEENLDAFRGCLVGGAIGDALGYPVEFLDYDVIVKQFGENGITEYAIDSIEEKALISDDTQMTLFTANGILYGFTKLRMTGTCEPVENYIYYSYLDWFSTQSGLSSKKPISWLLEIDELYSNRAPGNTCLNALSSGYMGTISEPINSSKGCGGVMRVAPIALYFNQDCDEPEKVMLIAAKAAAVTHGHPLGYMSAGALAFIINRIAYGGCTVGDTLDDVIKECQILLQEMFNGSEDLDKLIEIMELAVELSKNDDTDYNNIKRIGGGWVAEETLAIAIYCTLKYVDDFDAAIIASVNHDGDCDSTGAVTGNIVGTIVGYEGISDKWRDKLELRDTVMQIADDLCHDCQMIQDGEYRDEVWIGKYCRY